jgi:hypothetical protein
MGGSTPAAPDTIGAAMVQGQLNEAAAKAKIAADRPISQVNAMGDNQWWTDLGNGRWESKTYLSNQRALIRDAQQRQQLAGAKLGDTMMPDYEKFIKSNTDPTTGAPAWQKLDLNNLPGAGRVDYSSLGKMPTLDYSSLGKMPVADGAVRKRVEDALYRRAQSRLDPRFNQESTQLNDRLARMGFMPGSGASNKSLSNFGRTKNDAYQNAINEAIIGGGTEQSRLFDLAMKARQQGVSEIGNRYGAGMEGRKQGVSELDKKFQNMNELRTSAIGERSLANAANNELRGQMISEKQGIRGNRLAEMLQAMSMGGPQIGEPVFTNPSVAPGADPADYQSAVQADYQNRANAASASSARTQGYVGAGVAAASAIAIIA